LFARVYRTFCCAAEIILQDAKHCFSFANNTVKS
jgi:hypothetical protein